MLPTRCSGLSRACILHCIAITKHPNQSAVPSCCPCLHPLPLLTCVAGPGLGAKPVHKHRWHVTLSARGEHGRHLASVEHLAGGGVGASGSTPRQQATGQETSQLNGIY